MQRKKPKDLDDSIAVVSSSRCASANRINQHSITNTALVGLSTEAIVMEINVEVSFAKGQLELDCPSITVRRLSSEKPITYTGPGFIRHTAKRQLEFRIYDPSSGMAAFLASLDTVNSAVAGRLIPDDHWYSLSATDLYGRRWTTERTLIDTNSSSGSGVVVSGALESLTSENAHSKPVTASSINLWFADDRLIPAIQMTHQQPIVEERQMQPSTFNSAVVDTCGCHFLARRKDASLTVELSSESSFPAHAETRVTEALEFVLGRTLWWSMMSKVDAGREATVFRCERGDHRAKMGPPINFQNNMIVHACVWQLFDKYLTHIWTLETDRFHPISGWLHFVRSASKGSIYTKGLALGVAVEGVMKAAFPDVGKPSSTQLEQIKAATDYMNGWDDDSGIRERVVGAIRAMLTPRVKDQLREMVSKGVVTKEQLNAWDKLRNKTAHAAPPESKDREEIQAWVDLCHTVEVLLYRLVYAAIGYCGPYTDYSTQGWPLVEPGGAK